MKNNLIGINHFYPHTPEPWNADINRRGQHGDFIIQAGSNFEGLSCVVAMSSYFPNARRIVACVNACAGLTQDHFDGGWTSVGISNYAKQLEQQRDQLLAALENAVAWAGPMHEAPVDARPKWFDESCATIASVKGGVE